MRFFVTCATDAVTGDLDTIVLDIDAIMLPPWPRGSTQLTADPFGFVSG